MNDIHEKYFFSVNQTVFQIRLVPQVLISSKSTSENDNYDNRRTNLK